MTFQNSYGFPLPYQNMPNPPVVADRAPTTADTHDSSGKPYQFGQLWVNQNNDSIYGLSNVSSGNADWEILGGSSSDVNTLTGDSGGAISPSSGNINILGGTGIATAGSGSTITINGVGGGYETTVVTADTPAAVNRGYITNKAGTSCVITLPATAAVGDSIRISGLGATGWTVTANTGQTISMNATTSASAGTAVNTSRYQTIEVMCIVANTQWEILTSSDAVTIT